MSAAAVFATYVHDLNPVLLRITDAIQIRWYGLAYLGGFVCGYLLLKYLAQKGLWVLKPERVADFIAAVALFGVFIGGRLGYILFYQIPGAGWDHLLKDPLMAIRVWEGGMASHGGILGVAIYCAYYAHKHRVSWTGLGDGICVVAPIGLFFGRLANFINGELYGRIVDGVPWAVKFPMSLVQCPAEVQDAAWHSCIQIDPSLAHANSMEPLLAAVRNQPAVAEALANYLPERHPSQLYEAGMEGALLFAVMLVLRLKFPKAAHGTLTAVFFILYAMLRIAGEQFREPDAELVGPLTKGQFFSVFMIFFGIAFGLHAWRGWRRSTRSVGT